jgi:hypothetical protein
LGRRRRLTLRLVACRRLALHLLDPHLRLPLGLVDDHAGLGPLVADLRRLLLALHLHVRLPARRLLQVDLRLGPLDLHVRLLGLHDLDLRLRLDNLDLGRGLGDVHLRRRHAHDDLGLRDVDGHRRCGLPDQDFRLPLAHGDLRLRLLDCDLRGGLLDAHGRGRLINDNAVALATFLGCRPSLLGRSRCGLLALLRRDALHGVAARLLIALALQGTRLLEGDWRVRLFALLKSRHQEVTLWAGCGLLRLVGRLRQRHWG